MSEDQKNGLKAGDILIGCFVIVFGLGMALAGGACTIGWAEFLFHDSDGSIRFHPDPFLIGLWLIGLVSLAGGLFCIFIGVRTAAGKYRRTPVEAERPGEHEPPET